MSRPPFAWRAPAHPRLAGLWFFIYKEAPINSAPFSCWTGSLGQSRPHRCQHTVPTRLVLTCWKRDLSLKVTPPHTHPRTHSSRNEGSWQLCSNGKRKMPKEASEAELRRWHMGEGGEMPLPSPIHRKAPVPINNNLSVWWIIHLQNAQRDLIQSRIYTARGVVPVTRTTWCPDCNNFILT